jgi:glycine/D-amino acid oxidase-like deaminating enzyme
LFADAGVRVALVESQIIGQGSTVASTALLMQEPDRDFSDLSKRFGRARARLIWRALQRSTRDMTRTIRRLRIGTDLRECESVYYTVDPKRVAGLKREYRARKGAGLPGRWLSAAAVLRATGAHAEAAIVTRGNAQVNPIRTCRGFIQAAVRRGAKVFERSPARRIVASKDRVTVTTTKGAIDASYVVVATGYATPEFRGIVGRFRMKDTYVVATRKLPQSLRARAAASIVMAWDTERPYHYLRWTGDGRLLVGGEDTVHRSARGSRARIARARTRLVDHLARVYPVLALQRLEFAWEGLFAETPDGLPYIGTHSRYPRHLFALGYGGNGMSASFLSARVLLDLYQGRDNHRSVAELFAFRRGRR